MLIPQKLRLFGLTQGESLSTYGILSGMSLSVILLLILVENKTTRDIAKILSISEKTVRNHISNTMQKLSVKGRAQAVVELIRLGEITL